MLKKQHVSSNASRSIVIMSLFWKSPRIHKKLFLKKVSQGGRNTIGKRVIRSKGSISVSIRKPVIGYKFRSNSVGFIANIQLDSYINNFFFLIVNADGSFAYRPTGEWRDTFSFVYLIRKSQRLKTLFKKPYYYHLTDLPLLKHVSNIEITPGSGAQYSRSAGSSAKLLSKNPLAHTALLRLPSGVRKIFSLYSLLVIGGSALKDKRKISNTKSGYWRARGYKSQVRGVAMNPVDHPHGGRTKSIKYPRTPWGKTTKRK